MPESFCVVCGKPTHSGRAFVYLAQSATLSEWAATLDLPHLAFKIGSTFDLQCRRSGLNGAVNPPCLGVDDWAMKHAWLSNDRQLANKEEEEEKARLKLRRPFVNLKCALGAGLWRLPWSLTKGTNGESEIFLVPRSCIDGCDSVAPDFERVPSALKHLVREQLLPRLSNSFRDDEVGEGMERDPRDEAYREQLADMIELQDYFAEAAESGWPEP